MTVVLSLFTAALILGAFRRTSRVVRVRHRRDRAVRRGVLTLLGGY